MTFQTKDSITVNSTLVVNSSGQVVTALAVNSASTSTISNSSGGTVLTISGTGRPASGTQTWTFWSNTNLGGPNSYIQFPDSTLQTTAYNSSTVQGLFSVTSNSASGSGGSLSYSNGVFTFTPALNIAGNAATVTNGVYTTDTGTVTNTMLAGSIANAKLTNSSVTVGTTAISLGSSSTTLAGLTSVSSTAFTGALTGNADTATKLATARNINGVAFDGTAAITVTAAAGTLTGTTLNSTVVTSSLTSVGTLTGLTSSGTVEIGGGGALTHGTGAQLFVNGTNYSRIDFSDRYGDPLVNGRSTGTRLLFNPGTRAGGLDCAIGMSSSTLWSTVQDPNFNFGWYAGDGLGAGSSNFPVTLLTLSGAGVLTVPGGASTTNNSATTKSLNIGTHGQIYDDGNLHIHTSSSTLWINSLDSSDIKIGTQYNSGSGSDVYVGKNLYANSGSATAYNGFVAGAGAISAVALQVPQEGAIRNLYNGSNNMYFDVSIGGSTNGQFQFRSSSSYTNVLTMSPTSVSFNTGAAFTARTPALARTAFNAAIDTEITVDNMRFRISNQGGVFPQVIGNGSSRNLAWTCVAALNGTGISQTGSTGVIVASNAWTSLYTAHGMDAAGDTITVTLQDKAGSAIYRITFMRSDNGSTTGYNIIGERIL